MQGTSFTSADLPIDDGRVYHLQLKPEDIASHLLLVGDPGRAKHLAEKFFSKIEREIEHRGLRTVTGDVRDTGQRISIVTSGMGTPSLEIALNELMILSEFNLETRQRLEKPRYRYTAIRVGTSGALQAEVPLGTAVNARYALGFDNSGLFYDVPEVDPFCGKLEAAAKEALSKCVRKGARFACSVQPYAASATPEVVNALSGACSKLDVPCVEGITASNSGFFAPQGREINRIGSVYPNLDEGLAAVRIPGSELRIQNCEMESSFLFHYFGGLGYRVGAVCTTVAHRRTERFDTDYQKNLERSAEAAFLALSELGG